MRLHADENIAAAVVHGLRRRGVEVTTTADANLLGASDEQQLAYCQREGRVIITHDPDLLRLAAAVSDHNGVAFCHSRKYTVGQLVLRLLRLVANVSDDEMRGRIEYL